MPEEVSCPCCTPERTDAGAPQAVSVPFSPVLSNPNGKTASVKDELRQSMVSLDGGRFIMGTTSRRFPSDGEGPLREVTLNPFAIAPFEVTNRQFAAFAADTGYVTEAEKFSWSFVFHHFVSEATKQTVNAAVQAAPWWLQVHGADWKRPHGPDSTWKDIPDNPVVHVSWNDAVAFAGWAGMRLPTEAEWEFAARGGLEQASFAWGNELTPGGKHMCNIWQGEFPNRNTLEDGFHGAAPVGSFPANGFGLYDVAGNVWEWTSDWFSATYHAHQRPETCVNPPGPRSGQAKVIKGGSYLCHESYCNRYRVGARSSSTPDSSTGNMGFRLAMDV